MKENRMIEQLQGWVKKEIKLDALPPLPALMLMLLPESPTREDIVALYLDAQIGMTPSTNKVCPVYRMASKFRGNKELFLALLVYGDEPEVRQAISEERARASFNDKGHLVKETDGKWPKGSAITDAMKDAQKRMIEGSKVSKDAAKNAAELRKKTLDKLAVISTEMDSTEALEKVAEYDAALQALLSDSGKLKHELRNPSLPEHPTFSFKGGRGPSSTSPAAVSATIS
jgi:hypothetical protein